MVFPRVILAALALTSIGSDAAGVVGAARDGTPYRDRIVMVLSGDASAGGFCTGAPLAARVVLTAAHCVGPRGSAAVVYRDESEQPAGVAVLAVERHPDFRSDAVRRRLVSVDLALLWLASPLPARFQFAQVSPDAPVVGDRLTVAGFGLGREGDARTGGVARAADLRAAEPASRVTLWAVDPNGAGLGACAGDSGGPMFDSGGRLAAVVAWTNGRGRAKCGLVTQGPLVEPASAWIAGVVARWSR